MYKSIFKNLEDDRQRRQDHQGSSVKDAYLCVSDDLVLIDAGRKRGDPIGGRGLDDKSWWWRKVTGEHW